MRVQPIGNFVRRFLNERAALEKSLTEPVLLMYLLPGAGAIDEEASTRTAREMPAQIPRAGGAFVIPLILKEGTSSLSVGRTGESDLTLPDPSVSRVHAHFTHDAKGQWLLSDAGSKNGTRLGPNEVPREPAVVLPDEAALWFGDFEAQFLRPAAFLALLGQYGVSAKTAKSRR